MKGMRSAAKTLPCVLSSCCLPPLCRQRRRLGGEGGTEQWPYRAASAAFRGWSKVQEMIKYTYSLLFISAHPLCISVYYLCTRLGGIGVNGTVKMRNGGTAKAKNMQGWVGGGVEVRGGTMSRKAARASAGEKATTRGEEGLSEACVAVLNISITDWVAVKMLLIQTPKHFYKTSISLSWLRRRGTHHGKQSKKIPLKEGGKEHFFSLSGFPPSALSSLCWRKANFHLHSFSFSCPRLKRPRALHVYWVLGTCSFWVLNPNQCVGNFNSGEMAEAARD